MRDSIRTGILGVMLVVFALDDGVSRSTQWGLGIDWTPLPGLQIRGLYRARNGPSSVPGADDDQATIEAHVYF